MLSEACLNERRPALRFAPVLNGNTARGISEDGFDLVGGQGPVAAAVEELELRSRALGCRFAAQVVFHR